MTKVEKVEASSKCNQSLCGRMQYISTRACKFIYCDTRKNCTDKRTTSAATSLTKTKFPYFTVTMAIAVAAAFPSSINGQTEPGNSLLHDRLFDPIQKLRSLTARATITVQGRDQGRFLTVFETSSHGHIEFGFPTSRRRPLGSLELLDITTLTATCCPSGVKKVVLSHSCSKLYLTVDKFAQARACQLIDERTNHPVLDRHTHCVSGRKLHPCNELPHFYLDSMPSIYSSNATDSLSGSGDGTYKLRFEKPNIRTKDKKILYAVVTRGTWELKLRGQNGILKRAVIDACERLWHKAVHMLFQKTMEEYRTNQRDGKSKIARICHVDPSVVKTEITRNFNEDDFSTAVHQAWRHRAITLLGPYMAWSHMSERHKEIFAVIASRIVKKFLLDSLVRAADMHCINKSLWGRLPKKDRKALLGRTLTLSWLQRRIGSTQVIIYNIEKYLDSRTTTFIINENG